ncbi:MAG: hypothetical protein ACT6QM_06075 [Brevundimonas mediterranea]|uniref:hypothetical protein n=1 Tax=Brevundimonas mediterranea TaxID=74329 RepID=UPI004033AE91
MLVVYPATGGQYTVEWPWTDGLTDFLDANGDTYALADVAAIDAVWLDVSGAEPVACVRCDGPWSASATDLTVGEDFTITGLPAGATVRVGPESYGVDDGAFEFTSMVPASFTIQVELWPYLSSAYAVTFQ